MRKHLLAPVSGSISQSVSDSFRFGDSYRISELYELVKNMMDLFWYDGLDNVIVIIIRMTITAIASVQRACNSRDQLGKATTKLCLLDPLSLMITMMILMFRMILIWMIMTIKVMMIKMMMMILTLI